MPKFETQDELDLLTLAPTKSSLDNKIVFYANQLARMKSNFTLQEEKLLHMVLSQLNFFSMNKTRVLLKKSDVFDKLGLVGNDRWDRYAEIFLNMAGKTRVQMEHGAGTMIYWVDEKENPSYFTIYLAEKAMPLLQMLKEQYTRVRLDSVVSFDTANAKTLYLWLCSWSDGYSNFRWFTTKDLMDMFGVTNKQYRTKNGSFHRSGFERATLDKAIREINAKTEIHIGTGKIKKLKNGTETELLYEKKHKHGEVDRYDLTWVRRDWEDYYNKDNTPKFTEDSENHAEGQTTIDEYI